MLGKTTWRKRAWTIYLWKSISDRGYEKHKDFAAGACLTHSTTNSTEANMAAEWWGSECMSVAESSEKGYVQVGRADHAGPFRLV